VQAVRWSGKRRTPLARDEALVAILRAVLAAAAGSLEVAQLTAVLIRRFPAAVEHADTVLDEETFNQMVVPLEDRPDVQVEVSDRAAEVYEQLSAQPRAGQDPGAGSQPDLRRERQAQGGAGRAGARRRLARRGDAGAVPAVRGEPVRGRPDEGHRFDVNRGAAPWSHVSEEEAAVMPAESGAVPAQLLALAKQAAAPQLTGPALDRRFGPRSSWAPATGQLWRAVREDVTALVVLLTVDAESVTVAPATVDNEGAGADADALVLDDTALGVPITVWAGLRRALPVSALDRPVDDLGADVVGRIVTRTTAVGTAGTALLVDDLRAELADDLDSLAEPAAVNDVVPAVAADGPVDAPATIDLDAVEPEDLDEAAARLGVALPVVLDLIDGKRPPTPAEAEVLREVLGAAPEAAPPPQALVVELAQPRWRSLVRQHRRRRGLTEVAARTALAYDVGMMAARQTGEREPSWPDRIRLWAQSEQLDPDADA
jgi:hypothetical protein